MKKISYLLIIFSILLSGCSQKNIIKLPITTSSQEALKHYEKAMLSFEVGDDFEMRRSLDSALIIDPNFAMALELYESQDPLQKKEHRERAKKASVNISDAEKKQLSIRESYRNGDMDKALQDAKWLVNNHGDSYESYVLLGQVQSDRRELEEAIKTLKKALELNPNSYNAYNLLMGHHIVNELQQMLPEEKRDVKLGLKYGDELIRIRPDHGYSYHFKANCYRQTGEFDKAKPLYEKSIENRKGLSSEGTANLVSGHNYLFGGDLKKARERYSTAIDLSKTANGWFQLNFFLMLSYIFDNDYIGAIENIEKVEQQLDNKGFDNITLLNRKGEVSWQKMICYAHNQMEEDAYLSLQKRIVYNRKRADLLGDDNISRNVKSEALFETAWVDILFGKYDKAKESLLQLKSIQEKRSDPTAMHGYFGLLGMANLMEGDHKEALNSFKKADETNIYFNYFKGLSLRANGDETSANKIFKDLANINFANWDIAIIRGLANKQLGKA